MTLFKVGSTGLALGVMGFAILLGAQAPTYEVSRTVMIEAPAPAVFARINDFREWEAWSPWARDRAVKSKYLGPQVGVGAICDWSGTGPVGTGRMTIIESQAPQRVGIALELTKPFPSVADVTFELAPQGPGTAVTWSMRGEYTMFSRAVTALKGGMDKAVGPDFERGLARLREVATAPQPSEASGRK